MSFAAKLKDLRMRSGKSLQELADAIGISKAHVWDLETGKSKNPSIDLLKKLSDYFKVSVATLVGEDTDDEELRVMFRQLQELDPNDRKLIQSIIEAQKKIKKENE
jgi:transcriptional regulator with XRE-family HTH domain